MFFMNYSHLKNKSMLNTVGFSADGLSFVWIYGPTSHKSDGIAANIYTQNKVVILA